MLYNFFHIFISVYLQVGDLIEGIFKAGFWVAIIIVALIIGVGIWLIRKFRR